MIKEKIKEFKKELVLQKAGEFLEKNGFKNAKMADIASYCGISVGALYNLFPSKDKLFYEYVYYQIDKFYEELFIGFKNLKTSEERIKFFIKFKFDTFLSKKTLLTDTVAGDPLFFTKFEVNKKNPAQKVYELLAMEFERMDGLKIEDSLKAAFLLNSFTYGYIEYWLIEDKDILNDIDEAYNLFIEGIVRKKV